MSTVETDTLLNKEALMNIISCITQPVTETIECRPTWSNWAGLKCM